MENRNPTSIASAQAQNAQGNPVHPPPAAGAAGKKVKGKKNPDPVDTNKLVEQHLARLERDLAGDREQEAEIGMYSSHVPVVRCSWFGHCASHSLWRPGRGSRWAGRIPTEVGRLDFHCI